MQTILTSLYCSLFALEVLCVWDAWPCWAYRILGPIGSDSDFRKSWGLFCSKNGRRFPRACKVARVIAIYRNNISHRLGHRFTPFDFTKHSTNSISLFCRISKCCNWVSKAWILIRLSQLALSMFANIFQSSSKSNKNLVTILEALCKSKNGKAKVMCSSQRICESQIFSIRCFMFSTRGCANLKYLLQATASAADFCSTRWLAAIY